MTENEEGKGAETGRSEARIDADLEINSIGGTVKVDSNPAARYAFFADSTTKNAIRSITRPTLNLTLILYDIRFILSNGDGIGL